MLPWQLAEIYIIYIKKYIYFSYMPSLSFIVIIIIILNLFLDFILFQLTCILF